MDSWIPLNTPDTAGDPSHPWCGPHTWSRQKDTAGLPMGPGGGNHTHVHSGPRASTNPPNTMVSKTVSPPNRLRAQSTGLVTDVQKLGFCIDFLERIIFSVWISHWKFTNIELFKQILEQTESVLEHGMQGEYTHAQSYPKIRRGYWFSGPWTYGMCFLFCFVLF